MAPTSSIVAFGLDSLLAIEVRNWIFRELSVSFQVLELMTSTTLAALAKEIVLRAREDFTLAVASQ